MTNPDIQGYRWRQGRGETINAVLEGRRIIPANHSVELRCYESRDDATLLKQVSLSLVSASQKMSEWEGYIPAFAQAYAVMYFELVLVDSSSSDEGTISTNREEVVQEWTSSVLAAPTAAPA